MRKASLLSIVVIGLLFAGCNVLDEDIRPGPDTYLYFANNASTTLKYLITQDVASGLNDSLATQRSVDLVFPQLNNAFELASGDSVIIGQYNSNDLKSIDYTWYSKVLVYNADTIVSNNLTRQQLQETQRGITAYVIKMTYEDLEAINFVLAYPKE